MKKENAARGHPGGTLPTPSSPRRPSLRVRASKKHQRLRKRELNTEKQVKPTITRNSSSTLPTFKPRRTQMAPGYIGVSWPEKPRGSQEVCCRERRKQARMEGAMDRKRHNMMGRSKVIRPVFRRRDGTQHHGQEAVGKATTSGNKIAQINIPNYLGSLKRQIASEKRSHTEFTGKKQQYNSLHRETHSSSTWRSKHVKECDELERQLKELRNRSRALFEAKGRALSNDGHKKSYQNQNEPNDTDGFYLSMEGIGKGRSHLYGGLEKEKKGKLIERAELSKHGTQSLPNRMVGETIHKMKGLDESYLSNYRVEGARGRNNYSYREHEALQHGVEENDSSDSLHLNGGGDNEVQEMAKFVARIGKEEAEMEEKIGSLEKSLPVHLSDTPQRFHKLEQDMKEMHRYLDRMGREKFGSVSLLSSANAQEMPKTMDVSRSTPTRVGRQLRTERDTRVSDGIGFQSKTFEDRLTGSPGFRDLEKKVNTLGHEFSHLKAGGESQGGGVLQNTLSYPVKEHIGRSLTGGGYDNVADMVRSDRGRQAAPSSGIEWKPIRDPSIYSDADASARKKELDARVLTSTLLLYATTPPDESLGPKHHNGGVTEQELDETSEERAAVAAFLSNRDGDGVKRVVRRVVKLYHLDGLQRLCLSRPTHNPKHRTRQVLFFKGEVSPSLLERIVESGDPPKPIPLDPPLCQHMGIKLSTSVKCVEDETISPPRGLQNSVQQCLLVFSDLGSISEMSSREGESSSKMMDRVAASGFTSLVLENKQDNGYSIWEYYLLGKQSQLAVPV